MVTTGWQEGTKRITIPPTVTTGKGPFGPGFHQPGMELFHSWSPTLDSAYCLEAHLWSFSFMARFILSVTSHLLNVSYLKVFLQFALFPDSGLKMKRKSYCLITTSIASIKCCLKVNRLHMLKTLELLTDHCKVSRIFNNLHGTFIYVIFQTEQASVLLPYSLLDGIIGALQDLIEQQSFFLKKECLTPKNI